LKTSGALYGSNTKRFDGKDEKVGSSVVPFLASLAFPALFAEVKWNEKTDI